MTKSSTWKPSATAVAIAVVFFVSACSSDATNPSNAVQAGRYGNPPTWVEITPANHTVPVAGTEVSFSVEVRDSHGKVIRNPRVSWSSLNASVADVNAGGGVKTYAKGTAQIVAESGGVADTATVVVQAGPPGTGSVRIAPRADTIPDLGSTVQLTAEILDAAGNPVPGAVPAWSTSDGEVASVSGTGVVLGLWTGMAFIHASHGGIRDSVPVWVAPAPLPAGLSVTPVSDTIQTVGGSTQYVAIVSDGDGNGQSVQGVTWQSLDPSIATVDASGRATGKAKGHGRIVAQYQSLADTADVHVAPAAAAARVEISPAADTIPAIGQTIDLTAVVYDQDNKPVSGASVAWSSLDPAAAIVGPGKVAGVSNGVARITAKYGSLADTALVWVAPAPAGSQGLLFISPDPMVVEQIGTNWTFETKLDSAGSILSVAAATSSSDGEILAVNGRNATSLWNGQALLIATYNGRADTAVVKVGPATTSSVEIPYNTGTLSAAGDTVRLTAEVKDASGNVVINPLVTWTSLNPSVATVSGSSGSAKVTAVAGGTTGIVASRGTHADTATITVNAPPPPPPGSITWTIAYSPAYPTTNSTVTISASASSPSAIASTRISVGGSVVRTCSGGSCSYASTFPAGTYDYSVSATDTAGQVLNAGSGSFSVSQAPSGGSGGGGGIAGLWNHMRTSTIDYRIHYLQDPQKSQEYDFAASHYDVVIGGNLNEYKNRNPDIQQFLYDLLWQRRQETNTGMESWLQQHGYNVEDAYLHRGSAAKDSAGRVEANQFGNDMYWYYNLQDPGFRAWRAYRTQQLMSQNSQGNRYDGFFFDVAHVEVMSKDITFPTREYASVSDYIADYSDLLAEQRALVPAQYNILNQAQYFNKPLNIANAIASGGTMLEYVNTPYGNQKWSVVDNLVANGTTVQYATGVSSTTKGQLRNDVTPGNYSSIAERVLMWEYASYLMVVDPSRMGAVLFETYGLSWSAPMSATWLPAFEYDVGLATGPRGVLTSGTDGAGQSYSVYQRNFGNGMVVIRPQGGVQYGDHTAVTVTLPGTWRILLADGALGPPVTSVRLRNSEALVLVR